MSESMERPPRPPLLDENDRPGPPPIMSEEPRRSSKGLTLFIAGFALVAFGGIVWYAYDQGRTTGSEESAPLIRADNAPVRVRPEQPGGLKVPHQDKLIFEKLTDGASTKDRPVERLLPRPEQPAPAPKPAPAATPAPPNQPTTVAQIPPARSAPAQIAPDTKPPVAVSGTVPKASGAPRVLLPPKATTIPAAPKATAPPPPPKPVKRAVAPKPVVKPAPKAPTPKANEAAKPPARRVSGAVVQPVSGGRFRIQIAAFKNEGAAQSAWLRVQAANKAELGALGLTIERINIAGKGTFHRVQGGPLDEASARAVCRALDTRNQACIVVRR
ncbi:MAG: SPOR domain-containing protein [Alphaproteobacteria bacterium]|nr:SPOR domain-containing protein [Alphaproteobacteria bacterium]